MWKTWINQEIDNYSDEQKIPHIIDELVCTMHRIPD